MSAAVRVLAVAIVAIVTLLLAATACDEPPPAPEAPAPAPPPSPAAHEAEPEETLAPARRIAVAIYFPSRTRDGLDGEVNEIFDTATPGDRAKQILVELLSGPSRADLLGALPPGTRLRQVFVTDDGTAWVDFSDELRTGIDGGSFEELLVVYSVVNSIAFNVPEIRRVGFLIDGQPIETLNGHLDLRQPLAPDRSAIAGERPPAGGPQI